MNQSNSSKLSEIEILKKDLMKLTRTIEETKKRLPAHSIKPPIMIELLELEDQFEYLKDLDETDLLSKAEMLGVKNSENGIVIRFFNRLYTLSSEGIVSKDGINYVNG